ncbi:MAG: DUF1289 domain-containing protein [Pseudomonadales bacterium]|nr:DUF1289 domain-containing protein [Pseudomonadales bacterium]
MSDSVRDSSKDPCVRNCCLDDGDVCLGCGRTLKEITGWTRMSKAERQRVLDVAAERKQQRNPWKYR